MDGILHFQKVNLFENFYIFLDCVALNVPKMVLISTQNTAFGTKVTVSCKQGFEFVTGRGRFFEVHCELSGKWSETILPDCQRMYAFY